MKLYEAPRNSNVRVIHAESSPPGAAPVDDGATYKFHHIDGMYSYCHDANGNVVHLKAWTEVEIVP